MKGVSYEPYNVETEYELEKIDLPHGNNYSFDIDMSVIRNLLINQNNIKFIDYTHFHIIKNIILYSP